MIRRFRRCGHSPGALTPEDQAVVDQFRAMLAAVRDPEPWTPGRSQDIAVRVGPFLERAQLRPGDDHGPDMLARTAGVTQRYEVTPNPRGAEGTLVGNSLMSHGTRFAEYAHKGGFVLVDRTADARHADLAETLLPDVTTVTDPHSDARSILVRPDGVIVWESSDEEDQERLAAALRRWVGTR